MRKLLTTWIKSHASNQVLPQVTLRNFCEMESLHSSFAAYLANMLTPHSWIDARMLYAASAVFELQIVMIVGDGEPQLIAAHTVAGRSDPLPMAVIANVCNVHFWALTPTIADIPIPREHRMG
jgi:hypothetical protein